jgi:hypothetical protein
VLELLRAILHNALIVDSDGEDLVSFVADYANRREPMCNLFNKVIKTSSVKKSLRCRPFISVLHTLIPDLMRIMLSAHSYWEEQSRALCYDLVNAWTLLRNTSLSARIFDDANSIQPNERSDSEIKTVLNFSFPNLFTIFVFATRMRLPLPKVSA